MELDALTRLLSWAGRNIDRVRRLLVVLPERESHAQGRLDQASSAFSPAALLLDSAGRRVGALTLQVGRRGQVFGSAGPGFARKLHETHQLLRRRQFTYFSGRGLPEGLLSVAGVFADPTLRSVLRRYMAELRSSPSSWLSGFDVLFAYSLLASEANAAPCVGAGFDALTQSL